MSLNLPDGFFELDEQTKPATDPPSGRRLLYPKSDGWYELDSAGTESKVGETDHGGLSGLTDDDHSIYPLLAGRSGGQVLYGSPDAGEDLELYGTAHATKGVVRIRDSDLGIDDINADELEDRRIRNVDGTLYLTTTGQVEGRYLSKDSIEQLATTDLSDGSTLTTYVANALDATELAELQNIGATTISAAQWGYVGAADQQLAQADSPTFAGLTLTSAAGIAGDGLDNSSGSLAVDVSDFAGAGLEDDGAENLRIAAAAAGSGLSGGAGSALALDINGLTAQASPTGASDYVAIYDVGLAANRKVLLNDLPGGGGGDTYHGTNDLRLTLESGEPVPDTDQASKTTIYLTPYKGSQIGLYDGASWSMFDTAEVSLALGTLTSGLPYDVFAYDSSGVTLEFMAWSTSTTRATTLVRQDGVLCKTGALTRRYLGTFYTSSTTTTEDAAQERFLWNYYNRVETHSFVEETTNSWTEASTSWNAMNGGGSVWTWEFVVGVDGEGPVSARADISTVAVSSGASYSLAIALDWTSGAPTRSDTAWARLTNTDTSGANANYTGNPAEGMHTLQVVEITSTGTQTVYGDNGGTANIQSGMGVTLWR